MLKQVQKSDRGYTLMELMVVLIIIGVIAAISAPSFIGLLSRNKLEGAFQELLGAINEAQRLAMVRSRSCIIFIDPATNEITTNITGCLLRDRSIDDTVTIRTNFPGTTPNINFSYKGSTTRMGTIVLSSDYTDFQKCFVIALGTGIKRIGIYNGSKTGLVSGGNCQTINN